MESRALLVVVLLVAANASSTPFNPENKVFTASLGGHVASTLGQFKQYSPLSGVTPGSTRDGYTLDHNTPCDPNLGYLWTPTNGISQLHPLSLYYTKAGQIAGMRIDVFGAGAAQGNMINNKYYLPHGENRWFLSVSFRPASEMCSDKTSSEPIGDRLIINQGVIDKSVPLTARDAEALGYQPGSCMKSMGQHWFYDLETAPSMSWVSGNLLPVVPMYFAPGSPANEGKLNAFFFTSPTIQGPHNQGTDTAYTWDNVPLMGALPPAAMCNNFCNGECSTNVLWGANPWKNSGTEHWATFHVFFNQDPKNQPTCPGFSDWQLNPVNLAMGRTCPKNTVPLQQLNALMDGPEDNDSSDANVVAVIVVMSVIGVIGAVGAAAWYQRRHSSGRDVIEIQQLHPTSSATGACYNSCQTQQTTQAVSTDFERSDIL